MTEDAVLSIDRRMIVGTFILSLLVFTGIGALAVIRKKTSTTDYLLASRAVPAWLVALSAVVTLSSGFMFIGQIGLTYRTGLLGPHRLGWMRIEGNKA